MHTRSILRPVSWPTLFCAVVALGLVPGAGPRARAAEPLTATSASRPTQWTFSHGGKPVMVYEFDPQKYKPYVQALCTVDGKDVLRDAPYDHLHHHALMYGIKVNGVNFWEETAGCGVQKVIETAPPECGVNAAGLPQARLVQTLHWLAPEAAFLPNSNAPALLVERRTLTLTVDPARRETALHWRSRFQVGPATNSVTLTGANYHGLGMRFRQALDPLATHLTPSGKPDLANNRQDVAAHRWEAVAFDEPGSPATIAIVGATTNAGGDSRFFAMKTPFAYLSATQGLDREPLTYRRGEEFELNYLVVLYPEIKSGAALSERERQWNGQGR